MNADRTSKLEVPLEADAASDERISDPFAIDLFAAHRLPADPESLIDGAEQPAHIFDEHAFNHAPRWSAQLPRLTKEQAHLSSALNGIVPSFSTAIGETVVATLARYTRTEVSEVSVIPVDLREREFGGNLQSARTAPRVWATLALSPDGALIAAEVESDFAVALIDLMLGGEGATPDTLRPLSLTERTVTEFLWLSLIREVNAKIAGDISHLESVSIEPPSWLAMPTDEAGNGGSTDASESSGNARARGMLATMRVQIGAAKGLVRFYLMPEALNALDAVRNSMLLRQDISDAKAKLARFRQLAPDVALHTVVGETEVLAAALMQLELGDVVVVTRALARPHGASLIGQLEIRLGDGLNAILTGSIATDDESPLEENTNASPDERASALKLELEMIKSGGRPLSMERLKMPDEMSNEEESERGAVALDELWLTLSVELASRRVSLEELSRLRVGQLLELGCRATDPVELYVEGRKVARGELIDIEGQLGVRITQVTAS